LCLSLLCWAGGLWGHPQCLDYGPPFQPPLHLEFCSSYENFGCCDQQRDSSIAARYREIMDSMDPQGHALCGTYIKDILCQDAATREWSGRDLDPWVPVRVCFDSAPAENVSNVVVAQDGQHLSGSGFRQLLQGPGASVPVFPWVLCTWLAETAWCSDKRPNLCSGWALPALSVHQNVSLLLVAGRDFCICLGDGNPFSTRGRIITDDLIWKGWKIMSLYSTFSPQYHNNLGSHYLRQTVGDPHSACCQQNRADGALRQNLLELEEPAANHNGGQLLFGVDGYMYVFTGDGGKAGDPFGKFGNAQNKSVLLGKVLRIDVDGDSPDGKPYRIPPDNPFVSDPEARPEVYAYGVRNMWRCGVDRGDPVTKKGRGRIFCGDVGQNRFEEIDIIVKGGNYGWRAKEGFECYDTKLCRNSSLDDILPIFAYGRNVGKSVTGGYVYRGCESPNLNGLYIFGDFMNGRLMALQEDEKTNKWKKRDICIGSTKVCAFPGMISSYSKFIISFAEDEAGELYFLSTSYPSAYAPHGSLYKIVDPARRAPPGKCKYKPVPVKIKSKRIPFVPRA
ncbi:HHIP-like protein 2, partial [Anas platyrhynchos]